MSFPARVTGDKPDEQDSGLRRVGTGTIPNAKKPKSRPPKSLRDKLGLIHGTLPSYSGPYTVGTMDIEVPAESPRVFSHISRHKHHLLKLETVLMTLYYPAAFGSGSGRAPNGAKKWSRGTWMPRPRRDMAKAYGIFGGIGDLAIPLFAATAMLTKLPAFRNTPPARHWPPRDNYKQSGKKVKNEEGEPPLGHSKEPMFPLMFFSHGLGGSRTAYSSLCGEFASYGFVVCAVEHRDGSGARTYVNHASEGPGSLDDLDEHTDVDHNEDQRTQGYDKVDYIFPKGNPMDTSPNNEQGIDDELRKAQLQLRLAEIEEAYRVLRIIRGGKGKEIERQNLRRKGYMGASSKGLEGVDWSDWKHRFHCERVTIAGHSFGAATVIEVLRQADRFEAVEQGIIYDIWGAPLPAKQDDPRHRIHAPLLGINSEAFMYWPSNFKAVSALMTEAREQGAPVWLCTVRGTIHISQSDFSILFPRTCSLFLKATANPKRALDLNISASLEFLAEVMGDEGGGKEIIKRCMTYEGLLETDLLDDLPDEHRPEDKWVGARLKIPHEFRSRLLPQTTRKIKRKRARGMQGPGDEVWMHVRTEEDDVAAWREKRKPKGGTATQKEAAEEPEGSSERDGKDQANGNIEQDDEQWLGRPSSLQ